MIALALSLALQAWPAEPDCLAKNSTRDMVDCTRASSTVWDRRLNEEYQRQMTRLVPDRRTKLRAAQRLWISYRMANCQVYASHEGTIAQVMSATCWRDMTKARAQELRALD